MARILFTWELGSGIGHLMNLRPIGEELIRRGHQVIAAVRDIAKAQEHFAGSGIGFVPAPVIPPSPLPHQKPQLGFARLLASVAFGDPKHLAACYAAWNTLFDGFEPAMVVADHSPSALLALRGRPIRKVNVGLGFFCPPDGFPLPYWLRSSEAGEAPHLVAEEEELAHQVNDLLASQKHPRLEKLSQIFNDIDEVFLATYREFDHYGERAKLRYWGHWPFGQGIAPRWPQGGPLRIYAYLKPFVALEELLLVLRQTGHSVLVYAGGINTVLQQRFASPTLRFESQPLDLQRATVECDLAITHAGHGTVASFLLAGKPCMMIPIFAEQLIFAQKVEQLGLGRVALHSEPKHNVQVLGHLLSSPTFSQNARAFAARYSGFVPGSQVAELVDRLGTILDRPVRE